MTLFPWQSSPTSTVLPSNEDISITMDYKNNMNANSNNEYPSTPKQQQKTTLTTKQQQQQLRTPSPNGSCSDSSNNSIDSYNDQIRNCKSAPTNNHNNKDTNNHASERRQQMQRNAARMMNAPVLDQVSPVKRHTSKDGEGRGGDDDDTNNNNNNNTSRIRSKSVGGRHRTRSSSSHSTKKISSSSNHRSRSSSRSSRDSTSSSKKESSLSKVTLEFLMEQGYTSGLISAIERKKENTLCSVWIVDNSKSMIRRDGRILIDNHTSGSNDIKFLKCTRFQEVQQTVDYHCQMAAIVTSPTSFHVMNPPDNNNTTTKSTNEKGVWKQQFTIAMPDDNPLFSNFQKGSNNNNSSNETSVDDNVVEEYYHHPLVKITTSVSTSLTNMFEELQLAQETIQQIQPIGTCTPLAQTLCTVREKLVQTCIRQNRMIQHKQQLQQSQESTTSTTTTSPPQQRIVVVIATDGIPTMDGCYDDELDHGISTTPQQQQKKELSRQQVVDILQSFGTTTTITTTSNSNNATTNNDCCSNSVSSSSSSIDSSTIGSSRNSNNNNNKMMLPINFVLRLSTEDPSVVEYWNSIQNQLNNTSNNSSDNSSISFTNGSTFVVLENYHAEAKKIYKYNKWLNYALPLHRLREIGYKNIVFDTIPNRTLTCGEVFNFLCILFGKARMAPAGKIFMSMSTASTTTTTTDETTTKSTNTNNVWDTFCTYVEEKVIGREKILWNPVTKKIEPWININELRKVNRIKMKKNQLATTIIGTGANIIGTSANAIVGTGANIIGTSTNAIARFTKSPMVQRTKLRLSSNNRNSGTGNIPTLPNEDYEEDEDGAENTDNANNNNKNQTKTSNKNDRQQAFQQLQQQQQQQQQQLQQQLSVDRESSTISNNSTATTTSDDDVVASSSTSFSSPPESPSKKGAWMKQNGKWAHLRSSSSS